MGILSRRTYLWLAGVALCSMSAALGLVASELPGEMVVLAMLLVPVCVASWLNGWVWGCAAAVIGVTTWWLGPRSSGGSPEGSTAIDFVLMTALLALTSWLVSRLGDSRLMILRLAQVEPLTGLLNRNAFVDRLQKEAERSLRHGHPLAILYLDMDNFKTWNDTRGHAAGDELLKRVGVVLRATIRSYDAAARLGGDEFAVLYAEMTSDNASQVAERLSTSLSELSDALGSRVTASMGLLSCAVPPVDSQELIVLADELMYQAKRAGKDQLVMGRFERGPRIDAAAVVPSA